MSKPTKITQIVPGDTLSTSAPLPATVNPDGRSANLLGTEGAFIASGPLLDGLGVISFPNAGNTTLTADQVVGCFISIAAGANTWSLPSAAEIVSYLTQQYARNPSVAFPNTAAAPVANVSATPATWYPAFTFRVGALGTPTLSFTGGCLMYPTGPGSVGAATSGALTANTVTNYRCIVTNSTPGSEAVAFLKQ
jgi:hypothetical protein